jgi:hypothetical protein
MEYKTPFSDAIESSPVPDHGTKGGKYDAAVTVDVPGRDKSPNGLDELTFDTAATSKSPSTTGIYDTLFKDAVK